MTDAHPIQQSISEIDVYTDADGDLTYFKVGRSEVTLIEACIKPGLHCDIPYVRVWKGDICAAEFCQHGIIGVYFNAETQAEQIARWKAAGCSNIVNGKCTTCDRPDADCDCLPF